MLNPLFLNENDEDTEKKGADPDRQHNPALRHGKTIAPLHEDLNPAANLIRTKIANLYDQEPTAKQELAEVQTTTHLSKHQKYMQSLSTSGKSLAEIQTDWHNYYENLSDKEKHEVWQEFYNAHRHEKQSEPEPEIKTPNEPKSSPQLPLQTQTPPRSAVVGHNLEYEDMPQTER